MDPIENEVELTPNPNILKACIEKSLIGKIWNKDRLTRSHVYSYFKSSWNPLGRLGVTKDEDMLPEDIKKKPREKKI